LLEVLFKSSLNLGCKPRMIGVYAILDCVLWALLPELKRMNE